MSRRGSILPPGTLIIYDEGLPEPIVGLVLGHYVKPSLRKGRGPDLRYLIVFPDEPRVQHIGDEYVRPVEGANPRRVE